VPASSSLHKKSDLLYLQKTDRSRRNSRRARDLRRGLFSESVDYVYSNVKITKCISVCGKCHVCHWLYNREERFKGEEFMNLHRGMIEQERAAYYERRDLAKRYPRVYMSLIPDGMAQSHCQIPHKANKVSYTSQATQHSGGKTTLFLEDIISNL